MREKEIGVLGGNGFVGYQIREKLNTNSPLHRQVEITSCEQVERWIRNLKGDSIVLVAAYTDTKNAHLEQEVVEKNNVYGPKVVGESARKFKKHLIFISTGFVFIGGGKGHGPYFENDNPRSPDENPSLRGVYADSKLRAEEILAEVMEDNLAIVRINFPFGNEAFPDKDYAIKILNYIKKGGKLYEDQYITPTYISDLVDAIQVIAENKLSGIFHVVTRDITTPYEFGKMIVKKKNLDFPVNASQFPDGVLMPKYGELDSRFTQDVLNLRFKTSSEALDDFLSLSSF